MSDNMGDLARSISRSLLSGSKDGKDTTSTTVSREFGVPVAELWDAITNPDRIRKWMAPVSGELKLGGKYQLEGNAGGTITSCTQEKEFRITWEYADAVGWVSVSVEPITTSRAKLTLTHTDHIYPEFWAQYGPGATGVGWDLSFLGLAWHVESERSKPPESDGWESGPEGVAFISACSEAWGRISIEWGTKEEEAQRAVANTTAFYTGGQQHDADWTSS